MHDSYRHKGLRRQLIEELQKKGITNEAVLNAMNTLPRHFFLEKAFEEWAYADKAFPIGSEQTISQPYTVAYMTSLLAIEKKQKVLEIGTGSGYQAGILSLLGARVYTVERQEELFLKTKDFLKALNLPNIRCFFRDGSVGLPEFEPYDRIIVTAAAASVPEALKEQLAVGGILVIPVGGEEGQIMHKITRLSETEYDTKNYEKFRFVPFLSGVNKRGK
ncbi:MAG: protein-L-isoaspartate(D-aspartate) O-methyltransferase [Saprospiraceae bacterium]|nr:protein-L-isoaspartate(D-aspartate) O-methyltransferase [Saprospiraceae bacterium]